MCSENSGSSQQGVANWGRKTGFFQLVIGFPPVGPCPHIGFVAPPPDVPRQPLEERARVFAPGLAPPEKSWPKNWPTTGQLKFI